MAVAYFSRVVFVPTAENHEFTEEQKSWLKRASKLIQSNIHYPEIQKIRDEDGIVIETKTRNYILSTFEWHNDGNEVSGSMLKEGAVVAVKHNRETGEVIERESTDTEYKINYYYDIRNQIVTFKTTNHFKDKQFNDALAFIIHKSIERESGEDCSFFNVKLEAITSQITIDGMFEYMKVVAPLRKLNIKLSTSAPNLYLTTETIGSGLDHINLVAEVKNEGYINLESDYVMSLYEKTVDFSNRLEEINNSSLGSIVIDLECIEGNKYSSTARGKYTRKIDDIDIVDFRNKSKENIEYVISNRERFL